MFLLRFHLETCLTVILILLALPSAGAGQEKEVREKSPITFSLETFDKVTIRKNATTQVAIRVENWPGQTFLFWLPEAVEPLWRQWDGEIGLQEFVKTKQNGLRWTFKRHPQATITAELTPRSNSLLAEVRVANHGNEPIRDLMVQNCLHFSAAPAFACDDFSRIHIRTDGQWKTLRELKPTVKLPMYYRVGFRESKRQDTWKGQVRSYDQEQRVDHPLIACTSIDGSKTVSTVSEDYQCLFHNQGLPYLLCIHSQQAPQAVLPADKEYVFRQCIYFIDGGIEESLAAYEKDLADGVLTLGPGSGDAATAINRDDSQ